MAADTVDPGSDDPFASFGETFFKLDLAHVSVDMVGCGFNDCCQKTDLLHSGTASASSQHEVAENTIYLSSEELIHKADYYNAAGMLDLSFGSSQSHHLFLIVRRRCCGFTHTLMNPGEGNLA